MVSDKILKEIVWKYSLGFSPISGLYGWQLSAVNDQDRCKFTLEFRSVSNATFPALHWEAAAINIPDDLLRQFFELEPELGDSGVDDANATELQIKTLAMEKTCVIHDCNDVGASVRVQQAVTLFLQILGDWIEIVNSAVDDFASRSNERRASDDT